MLNVLVTGSHGQLGSEIKALSSHYAYEFFFTDREELDISDKTKIEIFCKENAIDVIINCAAYTAVDKAEDEEEIADAVNRQAVRYLAEISKAYSIKLIHISTDYVFDGTNFKPYTEIDRPGPNNVYGQTKLAGEKAMISVNPAGSIIIRTSWLYSGYGSNFVKTMLRLGKERDRLGVVFDQVGTPTYARDLAEAVLQILNVDTTRDPVEIYHYSNEGVCSWYDLAKAIFEISGIQCEVNPIETVEYPTPAARPSYSLLNKSKIKKEYNIAIPYWRDSLKECLEKMGERNNV
jgi:dTDP-4-dehydrorhamnose reductase